MADEKKPPVGTQAGINPNISDTIPGIRGERATPLISGDELDVEVRKTGAEIIPHPELSPPEVSTEPLNEEKFEAKYPTGVPAGPVLPPQVPGVVESPVPKLKVSLPPGVIEENLNVKGNKLYPITWISGEVKRETDRITAIERKKLTQEKAA